MIPLYYDDVSSILKEFSPISKALYTDNGDYILMTDVELDIWRLFCGSAMKDLRDMSFWNAILSQNISDTVTSILRKNLFSLDSTLYYKGYFIVAVGLDTSDRHFFIMLDKDTFNPVAYYYKDCDIYKGYELFAPVVMSLKEFDFS